MLPVNIHEPLIPSFTLGVKCVPRSPLGGEGKGEGDFPIRIPHSAFGTQSSPNNDTILN